MSPFDFAFFSPFFYLFLLFLVSEKDAETGPEAVNEATNLDVVRSREDPG